MVDTSSGLVLQDPAGSYITTFDAAPTNIISPSELVSAGMTGPSTVVQIAVSTASQMRTSIVAPASQTTVTAANSLAQQTTDLQASLNSASVGVT